MKILDKYIFKELATPFLTSLFVITFVLLSNSILKNIDKFLGKGIELWVVLKFIFLHFGHIFALAIPMAILITTLIAFGRMSGDNEIIALKSSGITYFQILKPALSFAILVIIFMIPFNLWILPEMNHNIKKLSYSMSRSRPDVEFNEQLLNNLGDKTIYIGKRLDKNLFEEIVIFDKTGYNNHTTILADIGSFISLDDGIILNLKNGSIHENIKKNKEYRKTYFDNYRITIPFDELNFNNNIAISRQDREMNISSLIDKVKYYKNKIHLIEINIKDNTTLLDSLEKSLSILKTTNKNNPLELKLINNRINNIKSKQEKNKKIIPQHKKEINKYNVEIQKKFSLPLACLFFILLGVPLGIMAKKGSLSVSIGISLLFFIIYWAFLVLGENFSDKNKLNPIIAMWTPNILIGLFSYYLYLLYTRDNKTLKLNFYFRKKEKK